jgi:hypothetical protein
MTVFNTRAGARKVAVELSGPVASGIPALQDVPFEDGYG